MGYRIFPTVSYMKTALTRYDFWIRRRGFAPPGENLAPHCQHHLTLYSIVLLLSMFLQL